ncbi:MAG TPA: LysR substrate-binding domain-containing protein [Pelomicrobium sp.]|nr:LysR substrate-binding domain-containing protein [Pelomicrobium sp.]
MAALPSLRQLAYLVALAERLNFRQAAEAQFVTQSTLSAGIKELERTLGVQLVERDRRHVRLTPIGAEVVRRARGLLAEAADLAEVARGAGEPLAGPFTLGVIPTIAPFLLPEVLPALRRRHPKLALFLREELTARLLEHVRDGSIDAALIALPFDTGELTLKKLFRDEFVFVARADDAWTKQPAVPIRQVPADHLVLLEEGHCLREHAIAACGTRRASPQAAVVATSLVTLLQMVEGGLGATLLPEMVVAAGVLKGTRLAARPIAGTPPARTIALATRPTSPRLAEVELLAQAMVEAARAPARKGARRA